MNIVQGISAHKLFDVLQKEYLVCILRAKIYPFEKHKLYWSKLSEQKKEKIFNLKLKYKLISIFDDKNIMETYEIKTYNEFGLPNFYYPNEKLAKQQRYWDIRNYFALESDVLFLTDNWVKQKGIVKYCNTIDSIVEIEYYEEILKIKFSNAKRIFS